MTCPHFPKVKWCEFLHLWIELQRLIFQIWYIETCLIRVKQCTFAFSVFVQPPLIMSASPLSVTETKFLTLVFHFHVQMALAYTHSAAQHSYTTRHIGMCNSLQKSANSKKRKKISTNKGKKHCSAVSTDHQDTGVGLKLSHPSQCML